MQFTLFACSIVDYSSFSEGSTAAMTTESMNPSSSTLITETTSSPQTSGIYHLSSTQRIRFWTSLL